MNSPQEPGTSCTSADSRDGLGSGWLYSRLLWIPGATILIALIFYSLGYLNLSRPTQHLLSIFIYSVCISLPCIVVLPWISIHFTDRFPRMIVLLQGLTLAVIAVAGSLLAAFIVCRLGIHDRNRLWQEYRTSLPFCIVITLAIGLAVSTYETMRYKLQEAMLEARTRQMEEERANKLLAQARLSSLESSVHPHFLFNTLNSIAALIPSDPGRAEELVGRLASLLRFSLNAQHSGLVPLSQELKVVRDYLEIEAARYGPRLRSRSWFRIPLTPSAFPQCLCRPWWRIPSSTWPRPESRAHRLGSSGGEDADRAWLEVSDDGPGFSPDRIEAGHGLGNLVARLELLLGSEARLEISRQQERTIVRLSFPRYAEIP